MFSSKLVAVFSLFDRSFNAVGEIFSEISMHVFDGIEAKVLANQIWLELFK